MEAQRESKPAPGFVNRPDYRIEIAPAGRRVRAVLGGTALAESDRCLVLQEADYPPVYYFPRDGVRMELLARTDRRTHCPFKGDASYWAAADIADVAWSYESPYDEMRAIKHYIAFYADRVALITDS